MAVHRYLERYHPMEKRIHNFNAGPAALPKVVLEEMQASLLNYKGSGMSILEVSHRSRWFEEVLEDAKSRMKRLLNLDDRYHVLFVQGGASLQFCMVPMNLLPEAGLGDYVNTGIWSAAAIKEAKIQGKRVEVVASSEDRNFCYIPEKVPVHPHASYAHITSNNTIKGTQWPSFPDTGAVPLVADMSSDILSRHFDVAPFGLIYAGAQKNLGPAGVCVVILRSDMLERVPPGLPTMLKYTTYVEKNSMHNTPPCFAIYVVQLVCEWLEETVGGLDKVEALNREKARVLYELLDRGDFYRGTADRNSRSMMNVTFRLPTEELEKRFVAQAEQEGLGGLKGHRSVGGCRASLYNATGIEAVRDLVSFMENFAAKNG